MTVSEFIFSKSHVRIDFTKLQHFQDGKASKILVFCGVSLTYGP